MLVGSHWVLADSSPAWLHDKRKKAVSSHRTPKYTRCIMSLPLLQRHLHCRSAASAIRGASKPPSNAGSCRRRRSWRSGPCAGSRTPSHRRRASSWSPRSRATLGERRGSSPSESCNRSGFPEGINPSARQTIVRANRYLEVGLLPPTLRQASRDMGDQLRRLAEPWPWAAAAIPVSTGRAVASCGRLRRPRRLRDRRCRAGRVGIPTSGGASA